MKTQENKSFSKTSKNLRSQGEIFGIALMFVIIIVGFVIYSQVKALNPNNEINLETEKRYQTLAEGTLNTLLKTSTSCYIEKGKDTIKDLINFCLEVSSVGGDPEFTCDAKTTIQACSYSIEFLNDTLNTLFNKNGIGEIPFYMRIDVPDNPDSLLSNITLTNFNNITYKNKIVTENNYHSLGFKRAPSGLRTWATSQRNIRLELYLYYK